jgi:hypothetical protein
MVGWGTSKFTILFPISHTNFFTKQVTTLLLLHCYAACFLVLFFFFSSSFVFKAIELKKFQVFLQKKQKPNKVYKQNVGNIYAFKNVYKGPVAMEVHRGSSMDEIQQYVDARWICAPEAFWKIFQFTLYRLYPSVERLQIHLPNPHQVPYYNHQRIADVLNDDRNSKTMLTQFFALNRRDPHSRKYLYREIPKHYWWNDKVKEWNRRVSS